MHNLLFYGGWDAQPSILWRFGCTACYFMEMGMHRLLFYGSSDTQPSILWKLGCITSYIMEVGMHNLLFYGGSDAHPFILWHTESTQVLDTFPSYGKFADDLIYIAIRALSLRNSHPSEPYTDKPLLR